tara:strand:+ start:535 stop:954 length:420 start_codon:yes stop_codon:yes gene_type:complete
MNTQPASRLALFLGLLLLLFPTLSSAAPSASADERPQVIVHQDVPAKDSALSFEDVRDIFLGKITRWSDGTAVVVGIINGDIHEAFCRAYLGMSAAEFDQHWSRKTGGDPKKGPRVMKSEQDMTVFIANIRGSIGYLSP